MEHSMGQLQVGLGDEADSIFAGDSNQHPVATKLVAIFYGEYTEANAQFIVQACNSFEAMKEALEEWNLFDAEAGDLHPCPDYTLRAHYKERARNKTKIALALAKTEE